MCLRQYLILQNLVAVAVAVAVLAVLGAIAFVVLRVMQSAEAEAAQPESNVQRVSTEA